MQGSARKGESRCCCLLLSPQLGVGCLALWGRGCALVLGHRGPDPAVPTGLTLVLPFVHRGLRATAKITYQAVLLENLVRRSSYSSSSSSSSLSWQEGRGTTMPTPTSPTDEEVELQGAGAPEAVEASGASVSPKTCSVGAGQLAAARSSSSPRDV